MRKRSTNLEGDFRRAIRQLTEPWIAAQGLSRLSALRPWFRRCADRVSLGFTFLAALVLIGVAHAAEVKTNQSPRVRPLEFPSPGKPGFTLLPPADTGIGFTNLLPQSRYLTNQIHLHGSGGALG